MLGFYYFTYTLTFLFFTEHTIAILEWRKLKSHSLGTEAWCFATASDDSSCYLFGGQVNEQYNNDLFVFNASTFDWEVLRTTGSIPCRRSGHTLTKINKSLYLIGGQNENGTLGDIYEYDIPSGRWKSVQQPGKSKFISRSGHSVCTDGKNRIFLFGGYNDEGVFLNDLYEIKLSKSNAHETDTTVEFRILNNDKRISLNPSPREHSSLVNVGDKIYLFGGYSYSASCNDGLWIFDLKENKWNRSNSSVAPPPGEGYSSFGIGKSILFFGGCDFSFNAHHCYNTIWNYNTSTDRWTIIPSSLNKPSGRAFGSLFLANDTIILYGGSKLDKLVYNDVWELTGLPYCTDPEHTCLGNGKCSGSFCSCNSGFYGHDCRFSMMNERTLDGDFTQVWEDINETRQEKPKKQLVLSAGRIAVALGCCLLIFAFKKLVSTS